MAGTEFFRLDKPKLMRFLRSEFRFDWHGIHGAAHWARVRLNGLVISTANGARTDVVELFALLHDSQRRHDGRDRDHGARAADFIAGLNGPYFELDATGLDMLIYACRHHSDGMTEADVTIQTCWDADRLDLARVGIWPDPGRLCTEAARTPQFLDAAIRRSLGQRSASWPTISTAPTEGCPSGRTSGRRFRLGG
ncbi:MAG: hypothetical protein JSW68_10500 [Burkholderiales bacterium]|nr:MAG: hypothetical protein JSW68_10500 [Burkholderiales bacterium]